jgi:hypothetical protein
MSKPDPEAARKSLAERYAHVTEDELRDLADNAGSLTDLAKGVLKAELFRRGLAVELRDPSVIDERHPSLVTLRRFRDVPDALLAKSILDSAEIECFLCDENVIRMDWLWSNALGGIRLLVKEEDASVALELLDQKPMEKFVTGTGEFEQPRCPSCDSLDISFGGTGKRLSYVTVAVGVPLPVKRGGWKCNSCGHAWHDSEGPEQNTEPGPS